MEKLYDAALAVFKNSYSPYSKFKVGASVLLKNGEIISGTNIENASYGLTNCAERSALFAAYSKGYRKEDIEKIMVIGDVEEPISPCGACRQVMSELMNQDSEVVLTNLKKDIKVMKVKELLPYSFNNEVL
ncbi:MAG: cytidine deaminase [Bacilli bacterium]